MSNEIKSISTELNNPHEEKKTKRHEKTKESKVYRIRLIPIWLRTLIVIVLIVLAIVFGLIFGYSVVGDGKAIDALKWATYEHIFDILSGKE